MSAYFDASGTNQGSEVLVVAGWVATEIQWERFSSEWTSILRSAGLDPPVFHATDFELPGKPEGWSKAKKIRVRQRLVTTIAKRTRHHFIVAVVLPDYARAREERLTQGLSPLGFAILEILKKIGAWAQRQPPALTIDYFFEEQSEGRGDVSKAFEFIGNSPQHQERFRYSAWGWVSKSSAPVQAADMLSYEVWKECVNGLLASPRRYPMRLSLKALTHLVPNFTYYHRRTWEVERRRRNR